MLDTDHTIYKESQDDANKCMRTDCIEAENLRLSLTENFLVKICICDWWLLVTKQLHVQYSMGPKLGKSSIYEKCELFLNCT